MQDRLPIVCESKELLVAVAVAAVLGEQRMQRWQRKIQLHCCLWTVKVVDWVGVEHWRILGQATIPAAWKLLDRRSERQLMSSHAVATRVERRWVELRLTEKHRSW